MYVNVHVQIQCNATIGLIMTNTIKTKLLTEFGGSDVICVELRP